MIDGMSNRIFAPTHSMWFVVNVICHGHFFFSTRSRFSAVTWIIRMKKHLMQTHWMLTTKSLVALSFSHHQIMVFVFVFVKIPEVAADSHLDVIGYFKLFLKWQFRFQFTKLFKWKQKFGSKEKSQRTNVAEKHLNVYANFVVYRVVVFFFFFLFGLWLSTTLTICSLISCIPSYILQLYIS